MVLSTIKASHLQLPFHSDNKQHVSLPTVTGTITLVASMEQQHFKAIYRLLKLSRD